MGSLQMRFTCITKVTSKWAIISLKCILLFLSFTSRTFYVTENLKSESTKRKLTGWKFNELTEYISLPSLWHLKVKFLLCCESSRWWTPTLPSIEPTYRNNTIFNNQKIREAQRLEEKTVISMKRSWSQCWWKWKLESMLMKVE